MYPRMLWHLKHYGLEKRGNFSVLSLLIVIYSQKQDSNVTKTAPNWPTLGLEANSQCYLILERPTSHSMLERLQVITEFVNSTVYIQLICKFNQGVPVVWYIVGKGVCKVRVWENHMRRDKCWNYIATKFERYTKHKRKVK